MRFLKLITGELTNSSHFSYFSQNAFTDAIETQVAETKLELQFVYLKA